MISWHIWERLQQTHRRFHVEFQIVSRFYQPPPPRQHRRTITSYLPYLALLGLCGLSVFLDAVFYLVSVLLIVIVSLLTVSSAGNIIGAAMAAGVGRMVAAERQKRREDLLGVTLLGRLGALWLVAHVVFQRAGVTIRVVDFVRELLTVVTFMWITGIGIFTVFSFLAQSVSMDALNGFLIVLIVIVALYTDMAQSCVLGAMVGASIAAHQRDAVVVRLLAVGIFLLLQMALYIVTYMSAVSLLPLIVPAGALHDAAALSLMVLTLFGLREGVVYGLWHYIAHHYDGDVSESRSALDG